MTIRKLGLCLALLGSAACGSGKVQGDDSGGGDDGGSGGDASADTTPPTVVSRSPAPDATDVPLNATIDVGFSEAINCTTINTGIFTIVGSAGVAATLTCNGASARLTPSANLAAMTAYTVYLLANGSVADVAGNLMTADVSWSFTTGATVDTTPPTPPTVVPTPTSPTTATQVTADGAKEAGANVELRWTVDSVLQQDWTEIAARNSATTWSYGFNLNLGSNLVELRSIDGAANVSSPLTTFTVVRNAASCPSAPAAPVLNTVTTPTLVGNQVLSGTKPANTGIWKIGPPDVELVPLNASTSWDALVQLTSGANSFNLTARDSSNCDSTQVPINMTYNPPGPVAAGELKIQLELHDLWDYVGDEFPMCACGFGCTPSYCNPTCSPVNCTSYPSPQRDTNGFNFFSVDIWVEGPITKTGAGTYELCYFDTPKYQRKYTRYVGVINRAINGPCPTPATNGNCNDGWLWDFNYRVPNYWAALIETDRWNNAAFPLVAADARRTGAGLTWAPGVPSASAPCSVNNAAFYFPVGPGTSDTSFANCGSKPKMKQAPAIDGVTEATIKARFVNSTGQAPANGSGGPYALGAWKDLRTYRWDLKKPNGAGGRAFVDKGPYLITVVVSSDRARQGDTVHKATANGWDQETCWSTAADDDKGTHRAEGIIEVDGTTATTVYWKEKGWNETAKACARSSNPWAKCTCTGSDPWPCPATPNSKAGQRVLYLTPDKFTDGASAPFPVKVDYCPSGACP